MTLEACAVTVVSHRLFHCRSRGRGGCVKSLLPTTITQRAAYAYTHMPRVNTQSLATSAGNISGGSLVFAAAPGIFLKCRHGIFLSLAMNSAAALSSSGTLSQMTRIARFLNLLAVRMSIYREAPVKRRAIIYWPSHQSQHRPPYQRSEQPCPLR